ncbi:hypothetical protein [Parachryseolinea silvisoli]|uniref:hypothetical protein n=1 Tax=Parachryseolinea silvisoli TaxID=2873601 RepID=UPI002265C0E5|nr:hypothetical protein [Parachryseolinea silvisoli]MCD9016990.1 hypothetical protein [Parachryseolinea silvisoli]
MESTVLALAMDVLPPDNRWTLMLSVGIEYGAFREGGKIDEVKRFGAAKILALRGKEDVSGGGAADDGMGAAEVDGVDEEVTEDVPEMQIEQVTEGHRAPEMRYVYTMKEVVLEKSEGKVYCYTIPMTVPEDVVTTTETRVKTSVVDQPVVYISPLPEGHRPFTDSPPKEKAAPENWNGFSTQVRTSFG